MHFALISPGVEDHQWYVWCEDCVRYSAVFDSMGKAEALVGAHTFNPTANPVISNPVISVADLTVGPEVPVADS